MATALELVNEIKSLLENPITDAEIETKRAEILVQIAALEADLAGLGNPTEDQVKAKVLELAALYELDVNSGTDPGPIDPAPGPTPGPAPIGEYPASIPTTLLPLPPGTPEPVVSEVTDGTWRSGAEITNFMSSNWTEGKLANGTWKPEYVGLTQNGDMTFLKLDGTGSAQVQCLEGKGVGGRYGVIVKPYNTHRGGIVGAFLWLYSGWSEGFDGLGRFELDFEVIGTRGLQINYHDGIRPGREVKLIPGNFSDKEIKLEIDWSMAGGYADFYVDDELVHRLTKAEVEGWGMKWITKPMWPIYDIWAVNNPGWTGAAFDPSQTSGVAYKAYSIKLHD